MTNTVVCVFLTFKDGIIVNKKELEENAQYGKISENPNRNCSCEKYSGCQITNDIKLEIIKELQLVII